MKVIKVLCIVLSISWILNINAAAVDFDDILSNQYYDSNVFTDINIPLKNYPWYFCQDGLDGNKNGPVNCACACIAMAAKWNNPNSDLKPNDIRNQIGYDGYVDFNDLVNQAKKYVDCSVMNETNSIDNALYSNNIIIVIVKTQSDVNYHAIILNGIYKYYDKIYYTVYDPAVMYPLYTTDTIYNHYGAISKDILDKKFKIAIDILPKLW